MAAYTNQIGKVWQYGYDAAARRTSALTPNLESIAYGYNAAADLTSLTDGLNHTTSWAFSVEGMMTNKTVQGGTVVETNLFDADHRLTARWTPAGGSQSFTYDAVGNNTRRTNPTVTRQFDALNRVSSMTDPVGTTGFNYTAAGDLASEVGPWANSTVTSTYDPHVPHLRTGLSLQQPSGAWTGSFGYDAAKRLGTVTSPAGTFTYTYNGPGNTWTNLALPPGSHIGKALDSVARLTLTALVTGGGTTLNSHGYAYNTASQRTQQTRTDGSYVNYGYDNDSQVTSAVGSGGQSTENLGYNFDAGWNLKTRTSNGTSTTFTVDTLNQLTGGPTSPYTWDANGNEAANANYTCTYDGADELTSITSGTSYQTFFTHDGLGRLRIRQENVGFGAWYESSITYYLYDGMTVIQERNSSNVPTVSYTRGADLSGGFQGAGGIGGLLARSSGYCNGSWSTHHFYHADGGGNITYLMDGSQGMAATYKYDPIGSLLSSSGTIASANVYRFSSKEQHANSGLYYYGFRFYDPNLQRWMNRDPIGEGGGINLYGFVSNEPTDMFDPYGEFDYRKFWHNWQCWADEGGQALYGALAGMEPTGLLPIDEDNPFMSGGKAVGSIGGLIVNSEGKIATIGKGLAKQCVREEIKRGPKGGKKHTPDRGHDRKSQLQKKKRFQEAAQKEAQQAAEQLLNQWDTWNAMSDDARKLEPELKPQKPDPRVR